MSREVVENIKQMPEHNLFMKGVLSWVGGKTDVVKYAVPNAWPVIRNSTAGSMESGTRITSFSTFPPHLDVY